MPRWERKMRAEVLECIEGRDKIIEEVKKAALEARQAEEKRLAEEERVEAERVAAAEKREKDEAKARKRRKADEEKAAKNAAEEEAAKKKAAEDAVEKPTDGKAESPTVELPTTLNSEEDDEIMDFN